MTAPRRKESPPNRTTIRVQLKLRDEELKQLDALCNEGCCARSKMAEDLLRVALHTVADFSWAGWEIFTKPSMRRDVKSHEEFLAGVADVVTRAEEAAHRAQLLLADARDVTRQWLDAQRIHAAARQGKPKSGESDSVVRGEFGSTDREEPTS